MNDGMILRHRLIDKLDKLAGKQMIYVSAPAGYGKTVSIRQWLGQMNVRNAIMTLDEHDNDPAHLCVWFCASLRECQPENTSLNKIISHPSFHSAPAQFTVRALASLTDGESIRFIVDDLHFLSDMSALRLLISFLKRLPTCFQIVLISRNEVPSDFSELLVKGQLVHVSSNELLFSHDEISLLYRKNGISITSKQANDIHRFTGGWPIGISAVLLSGGDPEGENLKHLEEYIREHIWLRWSGEKREFLLKTSVVKEYTPALCTALTGVSDSRRLLDDLVRQNAFISCESNGVYRYHRLFHTYLTRMLEERGDEYLHVLLRKAGDWYLEKRDFYSAVECFIKCGDKSGIHRCFSFLRLTGREAFVAEKLIDIFDMTMIRSIADEYPHTYASLAWASFNKGRAMDLAHYADKYYSRIPDILRLDPRLIFYIVFMRLIDFRFTLVELVQSLSELPFNIMQGESDGTEPPLGIINQNMPMLHRGTRDFSECAVGNVERNILGVKAALGGLFGAETGLLAKAVAAGLLYEQGHLDKSHSHALAANAEIREHFAPETKFCAMSILACILNALGKTEQSNTVLNRIGDMLEQDKAYHLNYNFSALSTRCRLIKGDIKAARGWLEENEPLLDNGVDFYRLYGHFTTCGAYIAVGDYNSAIILLTKVLELVTAYNRPLDIIEAKVLLCIACYKEKHTLQNEAILHLEQAVLLAQSYKYTQIFMIMGADLSGMLQRLKNRAEQRAGDNTPETSFVKLLCIKASEHTDDGLTSGQPARRVNFTDKQKVVMQLLCEGKSYREMSEIIGIKLPTLRSHISLIYSKLDVTNEIDAIKKIKKLGVLEEN